MQPGEDEYVQTDPESKLEWAFIAEYLERRGTSLAALHALPEAEATRLMREASIYASARLSEVEAKAHYVHDIHDVHDSSKRPT